MILTTNQKKGFNIALKRYKEGFKYTVISGYAGSGKSTLVRFIIDAINIDEEKVCYCAFTGKAAEVLRKKGNKNVCTLHKLLYEHIPKPNGGFFRKRKFQLEYNIIVVDEVSMAPKSLMDLLFSHNVYIICLGDPGQLPPIDKNEDNHLLDTPHIFLDEIMRQEEESEIIKLTMDIRMGKPLNKFIGKEIQILDREDLTTGMLQWADQVICATNATRVALNKQMRDLLGRGDSPEDGDKVICLRNYWDTWAKDGSPLVNGTIGFLDNSFNSFVKIPAYITGGRINQIETIMANFKSDDGVTNFSNLNMDKKMILEGEPTLSWKESFKLSKNQKFMNSLPLNFTYGYAITRA